MRWIWRKLLPMAVVGAALMTTSLVADATESGTAPTLSVPLTQAVQAPVPVALMLGEPAVVRLERPVIVVTDSPPGLVHPIVHGTTVLVVPVREGNTVLAIGVGDGVSAKLAISIGTNAGVHLVALIGSSVADAGPQPAPTAPPHSQPDPTSQASARVADPPDPPVSGVNALIATMSSGQRQALVDYLRSPSLASLSTLVRLLNPSQQHMLVGVLADRSTLTPSMAQPRQAASPAVVGASSQAAPAISAPAPAMAEQAHPRVTVSAPAGIAIHVVPTTTGGVLYLSYVLQNGTGKTLRADPHEVEVTGASGSITIRQMDLGTPGEIVAGSMETGVIMLTPTSERVSVTWRLRNDGGDVVPIGILLASPR